MRNKQYSKDKNTIQIQIAHGPWTVLKIFASISFILFMLWMVTH